MKIAENSRILSFTIIERMHLSLQLLGLADKRKNYLVVYLHEKQKDQQMGKIQIDQVYQ